MATYNIDGFIDKICEVRNVDRSSVDNIIGMDEGKGSLKMTLTLTDLTNNDSDLKQSKRDGLTMREVKQYSVKVIF